MRQVDSKAESRRKSYCRESLDDRSGLFHHDTSQPIESACIICESEHDRCGRDRSVVPQPSRENLGSHQGSVDCVVLRLEERNDVPGLDRMAERILLRGPDLHLGADQRSEDLDAIPSSVFRPMQSGIGEADHVASAVIAFGADCNADAGGNLEFSPIDLDWLIESVGERGGKVDDLVDLRSSLDRDDELVSAEPTDTATCGKMIPQPGGDRLEQVIPSIVSQRIVDAFEAIDVEEHHGDLADSVLIAQRCVEMFDEPLAVHHAGEKIVSRGMTETLVVDSELRAGQFRLGETPPGAQVMAVEGGDGGHGCEDAPRDEVDGRKSLDEHGVLSVRRRQTLREI